MNKHSLVGEKYILTFIADSSIFAWVYLLKGKSHVFGRFKEFRALDENKCDRPIKCTRLVNGADYVS